MLNFLLDIRNIWNANVTGAASSDELDTSVFVGPLSLNIHTRSGGTGSAAIAVEHSEVSGSGFSAVPASALFNLDSGDAATYTARTTTEVEETLGLNRQQLKRYLRVSVSGTLNQNIAVSAVGQRQYTENYS